MSGLCFLYPPNVAAHRLLLVVALVMVRAIRAYREATGFVVGFKPAGGISSAKQTLAWQAMMREELGAEWLMPDLFRIQRRLTDRGSGWWSLPR